FTDESRAFYVLSAAGGGAGEFRIPNSALALSLDSSAAEVASAYFRGLRCRRYNCHFIARNAVLRIHRDGGRRQNDSDGRNRAGIDIARLFDERFGFFSD